MSRHSSPPLFVHPHHLNCVLLDPGSGCASPLSIDGIAVGVGTWSTSRFSTVQVGQTVLDRYSGPNVLVAACPLKSSRTSHSDITSWVNTEPRDDLLLLHVPCTCNTALSASQRHILHELLLMQVIAALCLNIW